MNAHRFIYFQLSTATKFIILFQCHAGYRFYFVCLFYTFDLDRFKIKLKFLCFSLTFYTK
jgi:hypothetical protein